MLRNIGKYLKTFPSIMNQNQKSLVLGQHFEMHSRARSIHKILCLGVRVKNTIRKQSQFSRLLLQINSKLEQTKLGLLIFIILYSILLTHKQATSNCH